MVLSLRHIEEMSYSEIAESLDIPIGTVKTLIYRTREMFIKRHENSITPCPLFIKGGDTGGLLERIFMNCKDIKEALHTYDGEGVIT